jgi:phosphatidylserine/phosphatidylglycerophosphate/cardiolipin synthase-like enzyme
MNRHQGVSRARAVAFSLALATFVLAPAARAASGIIVQAPPLAANAAVEVFFSPGAGTEQAITAAILDASKRVWIVGYYFTSAPIARALHEAHARGVDVRVVLDRSQATSRYSSATYFYNQRVPVSINSRYPILHHKFLVIDADTVGFGSMNFTRSGAQKNAENFNLFRRWPKLAETYASEYQRLEKEADAYRPGMVFERAAPAAEGMQ